MSRLSNRAGDREATVSGVAADLFAERRPQGRILVAGDADGAMARALKEGGAEVSSWNRLALDGKPAAAWAPDGAFDGAVLRLPRGWAAFEMALHALAARLPVGAPLWIVGSNDEGITSAPKRFDGLLDGLETLAIKRRARVLETRRTAASARGNLEDWRETVAVDVPGNDGALDLVSYPGLFAHGRLDAGTECLLQVLPEIAAGTAVLDFGCGAGVIARAVRERVPDAKLTLLDVDAVALHAARQNVPDAECVLSDGLAGLGARERFGLILSNPPLHRGKDEDFGMLEALVVGTKQYLKLRGSLVAVTQRTAGVGKLFKTAFGHADLLLETPQFQVWKGTPK
ncbi:methyltransferase [Azospirillum rugosum]|uniref:16S rRNA (Guanine1207-N2)-methyltransferase n=1 Tax=Azospirillum rugosum TaxID=416170 RepID=A0ABS4SQ35_9PROT|nr:methyltransferase [Azospirillum rugosum]MBP2294675.1 16S rRNA (guanine1207-N2)-methyltransferase [Azospirillum rugosum]MDQ0528036.1 16S rRNA (guanine1207-N2)-methyltransferase [Azospirillum rugosum]